VTDTSSAFHQVLAGRYEILSLVGSGGMGSVYRAKDLELDEVVALKTLRRDLLETPGMLERFRQEVRLARKVTHRNVARTFDIGEHEGDKFLTMELVEGEPLSTLIARERHLPLSRVMALVEAIGAGLGAAHAAGVVHRDLKPDNVLLADGGRVVITDFGLARALAPDARLTLGFPVGTPAYMAPEQVEGADGIDERADIYALGAIVFELVTGRRAWEGDSVFSVATARLVAPPPDPRDVDPSVPDALARVVVRCMAKNRDERYATAAEMLGALHAITLPGGTVPEAPVAFRTRPPPAPPSSETVIDAPLKTVAVLPFRNGGANDDDYLADGITEDLIDTLSMSRGLRVRSRGAVMRYKGADRDPRDIGVELAVQVVVDGSVRRIGDQLRVSVKLVSVADGFQLWARRFDRKPGEMLAVADEAASAIADALSLDWHAPARIPPTDPVALDLYLRAKHELAQRWANSTLKATSLLEDALRRAPSDVTILSAYAVALARHLVFDANESAAKRALEAAERAASQAPHLADARLALAVVRLNTGDPVAAAHEVRRALTANPMLAQANELCGQLLAEVGAADEGIARLEAALRIDPSLFHVRYDIARVKELLGQHEEADQGLAVPPSDVATGFVYWILRSRVASWRRSTEEAQHTLADLSSRPGAPEPLLAILRQSVDRDFSGPVRREIESRASTGSSRRRCYFGQLLAEQWGRVGDAEQTLVALEAANTAGLIDLLWLERCPLFDPHRSEPRFLAIREQVARRAEPVRAALAAAPQLR
jgi:serine/threonine-protein kinase